MTACLGVLAVALAGCALAGGTRPALRPPDAGRCGGGRGGAAGAGSDGRPRGDGAAAGGDRPVPGGGDPRTAARLDLRWADRGLDRLAGGVRGHCRRGAARLRGDGARLRAARRSRPRRPEFGQALRRYRAILANPRARVLFAAVFVEAIAVFGVFPHLAPMIEARGEGGPREAGLALAGFAAAGCLLGARRRAVRVLGVGRMLIGGRRRLRRRAPRRRPRRDMAGRLPRDDRPRPRLLHAAQHLSGAGDRGGSPGPRLGGGAARLSRSSAGRRSAWRSSAGRSRASASSRRSRRVRSRS